MSTKGTLYLNPGYLTEVGEVHLYTEMHDDLVHLYINDGTNAELNFAMAPQHARLLLKCMRPEGKSNVRL